MAQSTHDRHASGRNHRRVHERLALIAATAPAAAQLIMFVAMAADGRWLFALMTVPGLVGCIASAMLSMGRDGYASMSGALAHEPCNESKERSQTLPDEDNTAIRSMSCPPWEELTLPSVRDEPLIWRHIVRRWLHPANWNVTLGMAPDHRFRLDIASQGPHALVAGTTGSGKSVLMRTWCMALACDNPPERLNFVFLDFKGGAAFNQLARLPHVIGNVCDLDLAHATRALEALERELKRRERLVSDHGSGDIAQLASPPAKLLIVVDEFHALRSQLPDYVDRLVRIAALGRSLGMHLIACTQNPTGQVSADMKANIAINICLRVRDAMQSTELIGSPIASSISPSMPGVAYCSDGDCVNPFLCARVGDVDSLVSQIRLAQRFRGLPQESRLLFSPPLPRMAKPPATLSSATLREDDGSVTVPFGIADDGTTLDTARLRLDTGNVAIIGPHGRGKTTTLSMIERMLLPLDSIELICSGRQYGSTARRIRTGSQRDRHHGPSGEHLEAVHRIWLADDAGPMLDPLGSHPMGSDFRSALHDSATTVIFTADSSRHIRVPEHCTTRLIFPSGDRSTDLMDGVPQDIVGRMTPEDLDTPGRAVLLERGRATSVQCFLMHSVGETP